MSAEQVPPRSSLADPTRDIRLPPLPGTQPPAVPPEWEDAVPQRAPSVEVTPAPAEKIDVDQATDQLTSPRPKDREPTLTFDGSARERWAAGHAATPDPTWSSIQAPPPVVGARERSRRWPWVVLTLIPLVVIVGPGIWLLLLMRG